MAVALLSKVGSFGRNLPGVSGESGVYFEAGILFPYSTPVR